MNARIKDHEYLISNGIIITGDASKKIYENGSILVKGRNIADIGPSVEILKRYPKVRQIFDATNKVIIPGLVNTHCHSGLLRGTAENLPVFEWLARFVDPMHRVLTEDQAYAASKLCYAEALKSGTTCIVDMYRHMHRCADAAVELGIKAILVPYVADKPQYDYFETLEDNLILIKERNNSGEGKIKVWVGLEHLAYCTREAYSTAAKIAEKYNTGIHTHSGESAQLTERIWKKYGKRPIELFNEYGILGKKTLIAHCVWMNSSEIDLLQKTGTGVAHCPASNMKLGSGVAPVLRYLKEGVVVGLGSDGVKENNNLDLFEEMKIASLLQKVNHLDAAALTAEEIFTIATMGGAKALGLENEIGSLEVGKRADITIVSLDKLHLTPVCLGKNNNVLSNLVHAARGSDVDTVFVDGKMLVNRGALVTGDEEEIINAASQAAKEMFFRRERYIPEKIDIHEVEV